MSELRFNPITGDWVILATERARRPEDFTRKQPRPPLPRHVTTCPFCPGNEQATVTEKLRLDDDQGNWLVRVVDNKFAALSPGAPEVTEPASQIQPRLPGYGHHEVIIEGPAHDLTTAQLPPSQVRLILEAYRRRFLSFFEDRRIAHVILYKNHGSGAGTSLEHPHSQIVAMPMVPGQVSGRRNIGRQFQRGLEDCLHCRLIEAELADGGRLVSRNRSFVAFVPYAALSAFHLWIYPLAHQSCFATLSEEGFADLAEILREVLARLYHGLDNPDFNYVIRSAAPTPGGTPGPEFHWYLSVVPRLALAAGFELGTGMFINTGLPEASAAFLRAVRLPA